MNTHMMSIITKFIRTKITHQFTQNLPQKYLQRIESGKIIYNNIQ